MLEIVRQVNAIGLTTTTFTNVPEGLIALCAKRFDLVIGEFDMPGRWELCAELVRQGRRGESKAALFLCPPSMDFSFAPPQDEDAHLCDWLPVHFPANPIELRHMIRMHPAYPKRRADAESGGKAT